MNTKTAAHELKNEVKEVKKEVKNQWDDSVGNRVKDAKDASTHAVHEAVTRSGGVVEALHESLKTKVEDVKSRVETAVDSVKSKVEDVRENVASRVESISTDAKLKVHNGLHKTGDLLERAGEKIEEKGFTRIGKAVENVGDKVERLGA